MTDTSELTAGKMAAAPQGLITGVAGLILRVTSLLSRIPDSLIAFAGRFSLASIFWLSGQTKVEGFGIDIVHWSFTWGIPHVADSALYLFQTDYKLPFIPPLMATYVAAFSEHVFSALILIGLATRFSALALLGMTLTIQIFVYPDAYPTHGVWMTALLFLIAKGPGKLSVDHLIAGHFKR